MSARDSLSPLASAPAAGSSQREAERPSARVLTAARTLLRQHGLANLTMASIAEKAGCSRPAVYQYFTSKEEVVGALAIESAVLRNRLYQRVEPFDARPRERLVALAEVDAILHPAFPVLELTTFANALRGRISAERRRELRIAEQFSYDTFDRCLRQGIAAGDLVLQSKVEVDHVISTLATFSVGLFAPISRGLPELTQQRPDPSAAMHRLGSAFLDGLGWRPLASEWDYRATLHRIYAEVFTPNFLTELGLASSRPNNQARQPRSQRSPAGRRNAQESLS